MKTLRMLGQVLVASVGVVAFAACGSSAPVSAIPGDGGGDGGGAEAAVVSDAAVDLGPDAAPLDKTPIPIAGMPAMTWQFVPIEGSMCRDGSSTGIGVNVSPNSKQLMIYFEGGNACFNSATCGALTPSKFAMADFTSRFTGTSGAQGIFDRTDMANPVSDWNFIYVPYCTGDLHAGNALNAMVPGVSMPQQFAGYANVARYLARIVPTFPGLTKVLQTGVSAGGFGAALTYGLTAKAFGSVPVYEFDDSGPPMGDPYLAKCLQGADGMLWGYDKTILADCGADCPDSTNYGIDYTIHIVKTYPKVPFGLMDSTDDSVISLFYGFGANNCAPVALFPTAVSAATFTAGLLDARTKLAAYPNIGSFIFQGTDHTTIGGTTFDTRTANLPGDAGTEPLTTWLTALVNNGTVTNVGP